MKSTPEQVHLTNKIELTLSELERFGISKISHSQSELLNHLRGTASILIEWGCDEPLVLGGLCHSIYGTESFNKESATLENRKFMQELIGIEAERLAYLFGAHKKETLWKNLEETESYSIVDRFTEQSIALVKDDLSRLITLTLANWLEQRPRADEKFKLIRKDEFLASKKILPQKAYADFLKEYGLERV